MINYVFPVIISYLIGSVPFSYLTGKFLGNIDIRNFGSGNSGATNVLRTLGRKAGIIAFIGDFLKGFLIALISRHFWGLDIAIIFSLSCIIGHCYPVFLGFKGGKGVATTGGVIFGFYPLIGTILVLILIFIIKITAIMSLASISVAICFPILSYILDTPRNFVLFSILLGLFVIYKHKANIKRLIKGEESKIKFNK